jgi:hypothetical protein
MKKLRMKSGIAALCLLASTLSVSAADLKLHYRPQSNSGTTVADLTGSGYSGELKNNASFRTMGDYTTIDLGDQDGYVDLGATAGALIASLTDFAIATYILVDEPVNLSANGNFVWSFSNSTDMATAKNGNLFFSAKAQRYAISKTHWTGEAGIELSAALGKGTWKHIVYTQSATGGKIYIDGEEKKTGTISLYPKDLGNTSYNFIGRSCYSGDAYLKNTQLYDFRIYDGALTAAEIAGLAAELSALNEAAAVQDMQDIINSLTLNNGSEDLREDLQLPQDFGTGVAATWQSSDETYLANNGKVTRPAVGQNAQTVTFTLTLSKGGITRTRTFTFHVQPQLTDLASVAADAALISAAWKNQCVWDKVALPRKTVEGSTITWESTDKEYISDAGKILQLPAHGTGNKTVSMKATLRKGAAEIVQNHPACIAEDEGYRAYLFAYFTGNSGNQEAIRFAVSRNGYNYKALNGNSPIINSADISDKGGVRDPHILRGADGNTFYMVVTDMKSAEGWSSNHGIVLLKSTDLIHWTHSRIDIKATYPEFSTINRAWAPQTIYDPVAQKYMIYWSMNSPSMGYDVIHYAYANAAFTALEGTPQVLFHHPQAKSCIDGDIIFKDGQYHLFFKTEGDGNGIKKAVSNTLTGGYVLQDRYLQQTTESVEGSCVFRLINQEKYILMYDLYTSGKYQLTESDDLENFKVIDSAVSMNFTPRHGTVIPITEEEGARLTQHWGQSLALEIITTESPAVKKQNWTKNETSGAVFLPVKDKTNLSAFDPQFSVLPGMNLSPNTPQDFTGGAVNYTLTLGSKQKTYAVTAQINNNPVLEGFYADPQVLYSQQTDKYYIYPTSDGFTGWGGYYFNVFSSDDLVEWTNEGTILDLSTNQVSWATGNAWAPAIVEKVIDGQYKYFFYFSGQPVAGGGKQIGVATANHPAGPFVDSGKALITTSPTGSGQQIDPCVFTDPVSGKSYIYWGNGYLAAAELNDDMISLKAGTTQTLTPSGGTLSTYAYREGAYVFYRNGKYYFLWSVDDTGAANYHVAYGTSDSPLGPITVAASPVVLIQNVAKKIYGTGHNSVLQIPGKDEWYIVYHRINAAYLSNGPGYHRETCIDKLEFNADGTIKRVTPTPEGIRLNKGTGITPVIKAKNTFSLYPNPAKSNETVYLARQDEPNANYRVEALNMSGMTIFSKQINAFPSAIGCFNQTGCYLVRITNASHEANTLKLLVN